MSYGTRILLSISSGILWFRSLSDFKRNGYLDATYAKKKEDDSFSKALQEEFASQANLEVKQQGKKEAQLAKSVGCIIPPRITDGPVNLPKGYKKRINIMVARSRLFYDLLTHGGVTTMVPFLSEKCSVNSIHLLTHRVRVLLNNWVHRNKTEFSCTPKKLFPLGRYLVRELADVPIYQILMGFSTGNFSLIEVQATGEPTGQPITKPAEGVKRKALTQETSSRYPKRTIPRRKENKEN